MKEEKLQPISQRYKYYKQCSIHEKILQLHANKLDILEEMDRFLETYDLPKLNQEETDNLNRLIISIEIESVMKKTPKKQKSRTRQLHRGNLPNI